MWKSFYLFLDSIVRYNSLLPLEKRNIIQTVINKMSKEFGKNYSYKEI